MTRKRAFALLAVLGFVVAVPLAAVAAPIRAVSDAPTAKSWSAVAAADGVRVAVEVKDFLVVSNVVDAGGPSAQSVVNAFGDSKAYAAFPYPGEIVLTAHGLSQGAAPKYPLIAQSDATQPKSDVSNGPYHLHAESADDSSSAYGQAAAGGGQLTVGTARSAAASAHDPKTGGVTADAETTTEGVSIAGVLSISRVHSHAQMVSTPGKPAQRTSDTEVGDITVGGQQVGLTDKGLVLPGTTVPLPPDSTANALLSAAGITVHYLAAAQTPTSTVAPGLSVSLVQDVPGVGQSTVTYVFGQAVATAQATGAASTSGSTVTGLGGSTVGGASAPAAPRSTPGGTAGSALPGNSGSISAPPSADAPVTAGAPQLVSPYTLATSSGTSSESFYLVIAAGAVVMVAAAQLFRILAVKLSWT
jgi:hypothetical protein